MIIGSATANIDDNLEKANDAKDIAIVANNGVKDINSDNKLTPNEKLSLKRLYDSDVLKHDFDVKQLTSMSLPTADIDLALSNLTAFTAHYFANMSITETVDRQALNKVFNDFENADKAVEGLFNGAVQQVANNAKEAGSEAAVAGNQASEAASSAAAQASAARSSAAAAVAKVDNLSIGGRNYALNTANTITVIGNNTVGQLLGDYPTSNDISAISIGTKLTISYDVDVTNADGGKSYFGWGGTHSWQTFIAAKTFVEGKNHVSLTFDLDTALPVGTVLHMTIDNSKATYNISNLMVEASSLESGYSIAPEDQATQSQITQLSDDINLRVTKDGLIDQINLQAGNTLISSSGQLTLSGKTVFLDSVDPVIMKSANIADLAVGTAQIADGAINDAKIANLDAGKITTGIMDASHINVDQLIANGINGKTINGITINTPNLQLGTNGVLTEDWTLNQATSLFNPKKGSGTMTLTKGVLATSGTLSRWWSDDGGYWYGIGDDGSKIKNGSNQIGDNYGAGYAQHNIFDSKGNTLLRTYMDATGLYMNSGGTASVNTVLTQQGLTTTNVTALGAITGASLVTNGWVDAGIGAGHGIRIGQQTIQSHNSQDVYFNGDDNKQSVTIHAKAIIQSSQLSRKKDIKPLDEDYAMQVIRNSDMYGYRYNEESPTEPLHFSGIIDDVNGTPQFKMPDEFISEDRTGRNDGNTVAFLVEALKQADKRIGILEGMMNSD